MREALRKAACVSVLTGAGISAESGVPTFRGADGLWENYNVMELATPEAFENDPELVWRFYNWRRSLISRLTFNAAHKALAELETRIPRFTLITQNVDGLHAKAGSRNILEIHGNLWKVRCVECSMIVLDHSPDMGHLPRCSRCGGFLRPHVVWFGESLDPDILQKSLDASRSCEVMITIGTSAIVQPAASLAMEARRSGALTAEINLERTGHSEFMDLVLLGKAGETVPGLLEGWS